MSFLAKLEIDGDSYTVLEFDVIANQRIDRNGKPAADVRGGTIRVVVESDMKNDFAHWMSSNTQQKDGTITFFRRDAISRMKEIIFKKGYCIKYHESFRAHGESPMQTELTISAEQIQVGDAPFQNSWSGKP